MPITLVEDLATIGATEYSLPSGSTTRVAQTDDCVLEAWLDVNALAAGDEYLVRLYEKVRGAGTQREVAAWTIRGPAPEPIWRMPPAIVGNGWDVTVQKIAGTDRSIEWSLRKVT